MKTKTQLAVAATVILACAVTLTRQENAPAAPTANNSAVLDDPLLGEIRLFAGNFAPRGYMECDGRELPISQHQALFSILGTTYGGDGRRTFKLPDLRGRVPVGVGNGPGLTPHSLGESGGKEKGADVRDGGGAPNSNSYTASDSNMQPYLAIKYIIAVQGIFPSRS